MASTETRILLTNPDGTGRYLTVTMSASDIVSIVDTATGNPVIFSAGGGWKFGGETDYSTFESDGTLQFVGDATVYDDMLVELLPENLDDYPTAGVLGTAGASTVSGNYLSLYKRDGIVWKIAEGGAAGRMFELTFEDIKQVPTMFATFQYVGTLAHANNLTWVVYNYVTTVWDTLTFGTFVTGTQYNDALITGFTSQHISGTGQMKVGINHGSVPAIGHNLYLDEVRLIEDNKPPSVVFKSGRALAFRNSGYDVAHYRGQIPHSYKEGSNIKWHVHFSTLTPIPDGQTIIFCNSYSIAPAFDSFSTEATLTATFTNNAATRSAYNINHTLGVIPAGESIIAPASTDIDGTNQTISSIIVGEVCRTVGTFTDPVVVLYTDFHVERDTVGSRQEYIK